MKFVARALTALAVLISASIPAQAILFSGAGGSAPPGTLLTTLTLANTSASVAVPTNSVTPMFGHVFKKGDIGSGCTGGAPDFRLNDGVTEVPFSESLKPTCWSDGSLKFASFMLRVPNTGAGNAIPANGTATIKIYSGGSTPSASGRALSDFTAGGLDLNLSISGADSTLSGTWVSDLSQGITAAHSDDYQFMDGQAGAVWRKRASFRQSGADHGQLEGYWYVQALNDGSNNLAGIRYMVRAAQPWYDVNSPAKNFRILATMQMNNGASLLEDYMSSHFVAKNFTWSSGASFASTGHGFQSSWPVYLTTNGTLPTGLSTGTLYWVTRWDANNFGLVGQTGQFPIPQQSSIAGSGVITPSGAGSGTFTATPYTYICIYCSLFTADTNGKFEYIQGAGSVAADPTIQVKFNNAYWRSTRMLPPFDLGSGINPAQMGNNMNGQAITYFPQTVNETTGMLRAVGTTGQGLEMGLVPFWGAKHFYNQSLKDESVTRIDALTTGLQDVMERNSTTGTPPCIIAGSYAGLPTCNQTFNTGDYSTAAHTGGFSDIDWSHWGPNVWYAYLITGEPEMHDLIVDFGVAAVGWRGCNVNNTNLITATENFIGGYFNSRCTKIGGVEYQGYDITGGDLMRTDSWSNRDSQFAAAILPASDYGAGGTGLTSMIKANAHMTFQVANVYRALLPAGAQAIGVWNEANSGGGGLTQSIMQGFWMASIGYGAQINEDDSEGTSFYNYLVKFPAAVYNHFGSLWGMSAYDAIVRNSIGGTVYSDQFDAYITDIDRYAVCFNPTLTWTSGAYPTGGQFTQVGFNQSTFTNSDGDHWTFNLNMSSSDHTTLPAALSWDTVYYAVHTSGATFYLSATPGGSPITMTDSAATGQDACVEPTIQPAGNNQNAQESSYLYVMMGGMLIGQAAGYTVDSATVTDGLARSRGANYVNSANSGNGAVWAFSGTPY